MNEGGSGSDRIQIGVNGLSGRMGQSVVETVQDRDDVDIVFGIDLEPTESHVPVVSPADAVNAIEIHEPDVIVDFTVPEGTLALAEDCAQVGVPLLIGTTGFDDENMNQLRELSDDTPILKATNFSRGIQALLRAVEPALEALSEYDVELTEIHHNAKVDAPSGTANTILETITKHRDLEPVYGREGVQPRDENEVGVLVSRLGDVRGEHEVRLGHNNEVLTIGHRAEDRGVFAAGALDAAVWLSNQNPGWYTFGEVIDAT